MPISGGAFTDVGTTNFAAEWVGFDAQYVYWHDAGLRRRPLGGGTLEVIFGMGGSFRFVIDGVNAYSTRRGGSPAVSTAPLVPGASVTDLTAAGAPRGIAMDSSYVYWLDGGADTVNRIPKSGGASEVLVSGQDGPEMIAVDSAAIYWTNFGNGTVMMLQKQP